MSAFDEHVIARERAELARWGEPVLNPLEALMWRTERPPSDSWTGLVVMILDGAPDWDRVRKAHRWALRVVPRFTERVVEPIVPTGPPMWTPDEHFDLGYHLRRTRLPNPGSMAQLLEFAQAQAITPLDRTRPPWSATFVEGLEGGRTAYLLQVHHVLMDGAAATQLFSRVLDRVAQQAPTKAGSIAIRPRVTRSRATASGLAWQVGEVTHLVRSGIGVASRAVSAPTEFVRGVAAFAASLPRVATPPPRATSPILTPGPRVKWRFGSFECDLADLKKAAKASGGTVNDTYVAAILGGLRAYHERHGQPLGDVPMSMPVSMRRDGDPMGGNRFTGAFFSAPASLADPVARIQEMHRRVERVRGEPALDFMNIVTPVMNLAPESVVTAAIQGLNAGATLTASSWRGVPIDTYFAGAKFARMFVFGPLPGTSMCAALCTHQDVCCIAVNVDGDVFTDTDALWECLQEGLDEVLALGR